MTGPRRGARLQAAVEASVRRVAARLRGVHVRTYGSDSEGLDRRVAPDARAALAFYAWEAQVSERSALT